MKKQIALRIAKEVVYSMYKCPSCERKVPNYTMLTKNGCVWCDSDYWLKKKVVKT